MMRAENSVVFAGYNDDGGWSVTVALGDPIWPHST